MKPWAQQFYNSREWAQCREAYIASKQGLCQRCLARGEINPGEIVHHKQWLTRENINDPSVTLNWDNLELLCWSCHNKEHSKELPISEEITFDAEGNVIRSNNPPPTRENRLGYWIPGEGPPKNWKLVCTRRGFETR